MRENWRCAFESQGPRQQLMVARVCLVNSTIWSNANNTIQDTDLLIDCPFTKLSCHAAPSMEKRTWIGDASCESHGLEGVTIRLLPDRVTLRVPYTHRVCFATSCLGRPSSGGRLIKMSRVGLPFSYAFLISIKLSLSGTCLPFKMT